jgi:hypothetical protein
LCNGIWLAPATLSFNGHGYVSPWMFRKINTSRLLF